MINFNEDKQKEKLNEFRKIEQEHLAQLLSKKTGFPYLNLSTFFLKTNAVSVIPEEKAKEAKMVVIEKVDKNIKVAVLSPNNEKTQVVLKMLKDAGLNIKIYIVSEESLSIAWKIYEDIDYRNAKNPGSMNVSGYLVKELKGKLKDFDDLKNKIKETVYEKKNVLSASSVLEVIMAGALCFNSSDIHFEPTEESLRLRYRIDGNLLDIAAIPIKTYKQILSRIKIISRVKLNVSKEAQDGRFSIEIKEKDTEEEKGYTIDIRMSIIPGEYGEFVVLRILDPKNIMISLEEMGMDEKIYNIFLQEIQKPNGMILTTGPTGSGKTTALYASLKKIYTPEKKILTIENPIEYHLDGIAQTQTDQNKRYDFSHGLRSALRQDPDVIMVGEIRDEETAEIAVNAALTGHLVFSTLHTNNAAGTFPRLIDLGINEKTLGSAINLSMAQRLVRKLCLKCKVKREINESEKKIIDKILNSIYDKKMLENIQTEHIFDSVGCKDCHGTGYKSRIGLFEGIIMNSDIEKIVTENPSEREIQQVARKQGILTMSQDGVLKVLKGITSLKEISGIVALD